MAVEKGYLIVDIGTGNVRVAVTRENGDIVSVERDNVRYEKDTAYPDALYFKPEVLWEQILLLSRAALKAAQIEIIAVSASSQREGIVLLDEAGNSLVGLPNHDHRGREWQDSIRDKSAIYSQTGRFPSSLFSALKLIGIKHRRPEIYKRLHTIVSISDWAQYQFCGVPGYEHSQASETQLYDIAEKKWSENLCNEFGIPLSILPPLHDSGAMIGKVRPETAGFLGLRPDTPVVVGGADTQLAIKSTRPDAGDIVIVSGTTTPIVKISTRYIIDRQERTWTNRHVDQDSFILEANAGVTGLNYQRLKEIFYPNEGYDVIEKELSQLRDPQCVASLGSLVADEKQALTRGGLIFDTPVSHELTRASFVWAILWDIACCIKENYDCLLKVTEFEKDYVWGCGGGFQSRFLRKCITNLIDKKVRVRSGFQQASVAGATVICNEAFGIGLNSSDVTEVESPADQQRHHALYLKWKETRADLKRMFLK